MSKSSLISTFFFYSLSVIVQLICFFSITSYQTLPRNMPSHRVPYMPAYGDGYRSMPRNSMAQRDSICSMSPSLYDQALGPCAAEKRRSMRDDTMWQLYEWQQRQAYTRQSGLYSGMPSPKTMVNLSEHAAPNHSIPPSPSHGSLSMYGGYSPMRSYSMASARSEVSSPVYRRDMSIDRRHRPPINKVSYLLFSFFFRAESYFQSWRKLPLEMSFSKDKFCKNLAWRFFKEYF